MIILNNYIVLNKMNFKKPIKIIDIFRNKFKI